MYHAAMSHLAPIYAAWDGNAEAMASDIGQQGVTVRQWRNRGKIPQEHWRAIIDAAARRGKSLTLEQFLPPADEGESEDQADAA
jgi:hypothetical protein